MEKQQSITDEELVQRCLKGSDDAFTALYTKYRLPLFSYLHKLLPGSSSLVDDIFQQTWIKAWSNLKRYNEQQRFLAWLCRIGHNLVMDHFRRNRNMEFIELDERMHEDTPEEQRQVDDCELFEAMEKAIAMLSPEQREVVEMRRKGISFKEIADKQKSNLNTVLGRMHYSVNKLRSLINDYLSAD